jgi:hypothetical protein
LDLAASAGNLLFEGLALLSLGVLAAVTNSDAANPTLQDALTRLLSVRSWALVWVGMEALALYWARTGRDEAAAVLLGHLEAMDIHYAYFVEQRAQAVTALQAQRDAQQHFARGAALDRDRLVAYALEQLGDAA